MMLRLKGERADEIPDEVDDGGPRPADEITRDDAFAEAGESDDEPGYDDDGDEERGDGLPLRALGIAAAAFVPTFLAVFLGLPYLLGSVTPGRTPSQSAPVATAPLTPESDLAPAPPRSERLRSGPVDRADEAPVDGSAIDESSVAKTEPPPSGVEPAAPPVTPALPPVAPRAPEPPRRAAAPRPTPEIRKALEPAARRPAGDWTPAAAFADREAAGRLASSIQDQGYPVEIRQDGSSTRPWVVWIRAEPSSPRRR